MPTLEKVFRLEVYPRKFVEACSVSELYELKIEIERRMQREGIHADDTKFVDGIKQCAESGDYCIKAEGEYCQSDTCEVENERKRNKS